MDTEETTPPSKSKKFFKIALGVLAVTAVLLGTAFVLTAQKNAKQADQQAIAEVQAPVVAPPHIYTDAEKRLALEAFAKQTSTSTLSEAEKLRALKSFSTKVSAPILSEEQKRQALQDFLTSTQSTQ